MTKLILISTFTASLVLLAGCTTVQTNTNTVSNANTANGNANAEVATNTAEIVTNDSTNTADETGEGNIDTSDWLTYTNEEYGFSVKYPSNWIYFNKIDDEGYAVYDAYNTDLVRFTNEKNKYSASSFVDITLTVSEIAPKDPTQQYVENNGRYYIFNEGTWPNEESLYVMEQMIQSIEFNS